MEGLKKGMITHRKIVGRHCCGGGVVAGVAGGGRWLRRGLEVKKKVYNRTGRERKDCERGKGF